MKRVTGEGEEAGEEASAADDSEGNTGESDAGAVEAEEATKSDAEEKSES